MKGFANTTRFLLMTSIMLIVGACDVYYFFSGKWLLGGVFLLLTLVHLFLVITDCGTFIEIDEEGLIRRRLWRKALEMKWEEVVEWGVMGTGVFTSIGKYTGAKYLYFSRNEMSEEQRFEMCLHWPPKDKIYIIYTPKRFHYVMQNNHKIPAYYNVKKMSVYRRTGSGQIKEDDKMEKMKKVKTAIIGCGMISNIYIKNLKNLFSIIDVVALCDRNRQAAQEKAAAYGIDQVMTMEEIERSEDIELVVNLTNPVAHYEVIKRMLLAGKHVYTEKIMTADLGQGQELMALAEEKKLLLGVAPDTVLGAGIQTARRVIDTGFIGKVTSCVASISRNQSLNSETYRFLRGDGGALPYDVGIYYIGAIIAMLGPVKQVCAFGMPAPEHEAEMLFTGEAGDKWRIPGNNLLCGVLCMEDDVLCCLHMNGNSVMEKDTNFKIYGTDGVLELGDPNMFDGQVKLMKPETGECIVPHTHGYDGRNYLPEETPFDGYGHRGVGAAEMAYAIRQKRKNRCSKEYGYHCMEVLFGLDQSAQTRETYSIKSRCHMEPLKPGYYSTQFLGNGRGDAERSLYD